MPAGNNLVQTPKTLESMSQSDDDQVSGMPPPPSQRPRLKLKSRAVSQLSAPVQQFLASAVASPVPSSDPTQASKHGQSHDEAPAWPLMVKYVNGWARGSFRATRSPQSATETWQMFREEIIGLYEHSTLDEVMRTMEERHGFFAKYVALSTVRNMPT